MFAIENFSRLIIVRLRRNVTSTNWLPRIPAGDVLVCAERAKPAARDLAAAMEGLDRRLREWPVAGVLFVALTMVLIGTLFVGH
jgi:hypothetical protein